VVAACRECLEEAGILLADRAPDAAALAAARQELLAGRRGLAGILTGLGVRLDTARLRYWAWWVTPEPEPRRYDTRFFAARAPEDAVCDAHDAEMTDSVWLSPAEAVRRFHDGQLKLLPPTVHTLRRLDGFANWEALRAALEEAPVPGITPRMERRPGGVAIVVPE
jgi:8-oxo-dGTP pyrophosphatase MutT (NUDIX family)